MEYTMMYPAARLIELRTRERLVWDWEQHRPGADEANMAGLIELWADTKTVLRHVVTRLVEIFATGIRREAHA